MMIFVCLGEIKKIIGNDYEVTVMVPVHKYWKWPSKEDRIKSSWYYSRNIEGDIRDNVPPVQILGGRVPPVPYESTPLADNKIVDADELRTRLIDEWVQFIHRIANLF